MTQVAIIILNWNQSKLTIDTIKSILSIKTDGFKYTIFVVDNGSADGSFSIFKKYFSKHKSVVLLETNSNLGYVGGNNFGIKEAQKTSPDYVLVVNNDVIVDKFFLKELLIVAASDKSIGLVGPKIYFAPNHEYHHNRYSKTDIGKVIWSAGGDMDWNNIFGSNRGIDQVDHHQFDFINFNLDFLSGCCLLIKTEIFSKIGLFDEKYFMYLEDADFSQKVKKSGYKIAYVPKSYIWHINSGSSTVGGNLHDYFLSRNRLIYGFRYASIKTKLALLKESFIRIMSSPFKWQKKGILDYYFGRMGKGSYPL